MSCTRMLSAVFVLSGLGIAVLATASDDGSRSNPKPPAATKPGRKFAVLVGCTKYDKLPEAFHLKGPANDVVLMRQVLKERFGFADKDIVTLAEASGTAGRPTRANIKSQFDRLAREAGPGDQVMILLGGHGSQQPDQEPFDEPDGLDETFLPCDAGPWNGSKEMVANAIIDDELEIWTKAITDRGAALWLIMDSCHSGTMLRGGDEVAREVAEGVLVPEAALQKARKRAASSGETTRGDAKAPAIKKAKPNERLVGLYAAQSHEPTVERPMPPDAKEANRYGLLTYTICHILTESKTPLTYRQLAERVQAKYIQWNTGSLWPTPLIEGSGLDFEILGNRSWPGRSQFTLSRGPDGLAIRAGLLHGITEGSILAVYPAAGAADGDKLLGHVCVRKSQVADCEVDPCAFGKAPLRKDLPDGGRCELVQVDFGSLRLKVGIEGAGKDEKDEQRRLRDWLKEIGKNTDSPIELAEDGGRADILARVKGAQVYLMAADVAQFAGKPPAAAVHFGPYSLSQTGKMQEVLTHVARARNLLRLAADPAASAGTELKVEMVKLKDKLDKKGEAIVWGPHGHVLQRGDWIAWRVTNASQSPVDITFLFIDSNYGIRAAFPNPRAATGGDNRVLPGASTLFARGFVDAKPVGREHMVVIAVKGTGQPIDFTCLEQASLERAEVVSRGNGKTSLDSPLGLLLKNAIFAKGTTRGYGVVEVENQLLRAFSWTVATPPQASKKP